MTKLAYCEPMCADDEGWSDWVHPLPGYLMECCGCGLIHEMETAIVPISATDTPATDTRMTPTAEGEDAEHVIIFRMKQHGQ